MSKKMAVKKSKTQTYKIEVITEESGRLIINRTNEGFSVFELMGILSKVQSDLFGIFEQAVPKFDETNRIVK